MLTQLINEQEVSFGKFFHQRYVTSIGSRQGDMVEELRGVDVEGSVHNSCYRTISPDYPQERDKTETNYGYR